MFWLPFVWPSDFCRVQHSLQCTQCGQFEVLRLSSFDPYCATYGGQIGNVFVLPFSGFFCQYGFDGGWPSILYILGLMGVVWCAIWMYMSFDRPINHPRVSEAEKQFITKAVEESVGKHTGKAPSTPKGIILTSRAVWGWFGHFAGDWGAHTMLVAKRKPNSNELKIISAEVWASPHPLKPGVGGVANAIVR
ncbi:unnamed protein product [Cylicocyclus nassatus]|uniref:Uncharacterized protein n=1 Tax=Cylicocyclus nassatus TaxID=53992 RepID=A0AA36HC17_CYLNA|nr:unnamed protein product [Cylicocyclus nassatus]